MLPFDDPESNQHLRRTRRISGRVLRLAILPVLVAAQASADPAPAEASPRLALHWIDGLHVCPAIRDVAKREASLVFRRSGVDVVWREPIEATYVRSNETSIKVILVATHPSRWHLNANSLGAVMGSGAPRESAYVFANNVLAFLGVDYRPWSCPNPRKSHFIGRALARILVHEVVHAVAPEHPHSEGGLMAHAIARDELTAKGLTIDDACGQVFLAALDHYATFRDADRREDK